MNHRRDIDGLRAVAVLPVMLYHAGFTQWLPGGFAGVDVFFVISGYLITGLLLQDLAAERFSLANFYERRARRLLPALFVMLGLTLPLAWAWLVPPELKAHSGVLMASVAFVSNVVLWFQAGYFDTAAEFKPLLHTWSLGVEEQFYLLFPLLLWGLWRFARKQMFAWLLLITVASLAAAHWAALHRPAAAFFLLPTRAWELGLGALVAAAHARLGDAEQGPWGPAWLRQTGSLLGLAAVVLAFAVFDHHTVWPALPALLPTLGTAAVLGWAGRGTWAARALSAKPLVALGLVSYSAYLWHQPLLAFARSLSLGTPTPFSLAAVLILALALAAISWKWVETPFRQPGRFSRTQLLRLGLVSALALLLAGAAGWFSKGLPSRYPLAAEAAEQFQGSGLGRRLNACYGAAQMHTRTEPWCHFGPAPAAPRFLLLGDSHARALFPAFDTASVAAGVPGGFVGASACPPLLGAHAHRRQDHGVDCHALNQQVLAQARSHGVRRVYLVGRWSAYADDAGQARDHLPLSLRAGQAGRRDEMRDTFGQALTATVAAWRQAGVEVVVVPQVPEQRIEPRLAYYRMQAAPEAERDALLRRASPTRAQHQALQAWVNEQFARQSGPGQLRVLGFDALLCDATHCPVGSARRPFYTDDNHLGLAGAARLVPALTADLRSLR